ncbi:hypothetical protein [Nocardioides nanhaiensis]|uniref:Uncharacterized protein n=1 Tax=Nocardioides nanhaiensis TaxID=1476871 RepID=A0ABP8W143_9ACTN
MNQHETPDLLDSHDPELARAFARLSTAYEAPYGADELVARRTDRLRARRRWTTALGVAAAAAVVVTAGAVVTSLPGGDSPAPLSPASEGPAGPSEPSGTSEQGEQLDLTDPEQLARLERRCAAALGDSAGQLRSAEELRRDLEAAGAPRECLGE